MAGSYHTILHLVERLSTFSTPILGPSGSPSDIGPDLAKLGTAMRGLLPLLEDAERREEHSTRRWLRELKHVALDADDVLDDLELDLLRSQVAGDQRRKKRREGGEGPSRSRLPEPSNIGGDLMTRVRGVMERVGEIERERRVFRLREGDGGMLRRAVRAPARPPVGALVDESRVYGRDQDKESLIEALLLLSDAPEPENYAVVSIVGVGGLGKTTLAQMVYKDARILEHFQLRSWVHVSEEFDAVRLTRATIESITKRRSEFVDLSPLQEELERDLSGNRFLLVLDDVWNEEPSRWDAFTLPLASGSRGSRVLITTRSEKVAGIARATTKSVHRLKALSDGCCWLLFSQYAFGRQGFGANPQLGKLGLQIVEKCRGLPLAAKVLGGLLCGEIDEQVWESILSSEVWDVEEGKSQILPALRVSYQVLPPHLRQCFAYCAVFPKAYVFDRDQLIWMWMAQGFIRSVEGGGLPEDVGDGYFHDLLRISFFQSSEDEEGSESEEITMHDLIHDLAQSASQEEHCRIEEGKKTYNIPGDARHSRVVWYGLQSPFSFDPATAPKALRTCFFVDSSPGAVDGSFVDGLILAMRCLRVLDLSEAGIDELPDSIGNLKHLRYIGLGDTNIEKLPESIGELHYLQTLEMKGCGLLELPKSTQNLINLRHLVLDTECQLSMMPQGIGKLTALQTLPIFVVGKDDDGSASIGEMKDLNNVRGSLFILNLHNAVHNPEHAKVANLKSKKHIETLRLDWDNGDDTETVSASEQHDEVLESLEASEQHEELLENLLSVPLSRKAGAPDGATR